MCMLSGTDGWMRVDPVSVVDAGDESCVVLLSLIHYGNGARLH
jgi:hypothetical protein